MGATSAEWVVPAICGVSGNLLRLRLVVAWWSLRDLPIDRICETDEVSRSIAPVAIELDEINCSYHLRHGDEGVRGDRSCQRRNPVAGREEPQGTVVQSVVHGKMKSFSVRWQGFGHIPCAHDMSSVTRTQFRTIDSGGRREWTIWEAGYQRHGQEHE